MIEPAAPLRWRTAELLAIREETASARSLELRVMGWPGHTAGQHVDVRLTSPDGYQAQRSYSVASSPRQSELELLVEIIPDGEVSPYLVQEIRPGDRFELRGPIGGYFVWTPAHGGPLLLVGGGSGIVPLASMLAVRAELARGIPTRVLYSARTAADIIFKDRLDRWMQEDPSLEIIYTVTRAAPADWRGYRRRIDLQMLRDVAFPPASAPLAYVCGPTPMVEHTAEALVALGYPPERVRTERFGPTGDRT